MKTLITLFSVLATLLVISPQAFSEDAVAQSGVSANPEATVIKPYEKRLAIFSDAFDLSKKKVYVDETYPKELSEEAKIIFKKNGFEVVDDPKGEDVQIIFIEDANFHYRRGSSNWIYVNYNGLVTSNEIDKESVQKHLESLSPPPTMGLDAGVLVGPLVSFLTGATRAAMDNLDAKKKTIPYQQALTLKVSVQKLSQDGKMVQVKTIKPDVNTIKPDANTTEDNRFLVDPSELFAAAIDCLITCVK